MTPLWMAACPASLAASSAREASSARRNLPQKSSSHCAVSTSRWSLDSSEPAGGGKLVFPEERDREAPYCTPASGHKPERAILTCARDSSTLSAAMRRSRLFASASSTSLSSTGSLKSVHHFSGSAAVDCVTP